MINRLDYVVIPDNLSVSVPLFDRITVIGGDSSTGKSYIKDTARAYYNDEAKAPVVVFDYTQTVDLDVLRALKNRLIIIDNADILLDGKEEVSRHINSDNENTYLLFMRSENGIDTSIDNYAELRFNNGVLEAIYEYR